MSGLAGIAAKNSELAHHRRVSIESIKTWNLEKEGYDPYFAAEKELSPKTVAITKALLFIKQHRPDILDVSFLKTEPTTVAELAKSWDLSIDHTKVTSKALSILQNKQPLTLQAIKDSCKQELQRYINSRGSINADDTSFGKTDRHQQYILSGSGNYFSWEHCLNTVVQFICH